MRVVFAGTPQFALAPLVALHESPHELVGVLTQPDRPAGRGRRLSPGIIKEFALRHALPVAQPVSLRSEAACEPLLEWAPDVLVVVAYGLILPPRVLTLPRYGCLNIHASLLPRWRGAAPIQRAILAGDTSTGVSIMQMDAGLDTGPVWTMRETTIGPQETAGQLQQRLSAMGAAALLETLDRVIAGTDRPVAQDAQGMTYARKIDKAEALIDWRLSAKEISRRVRAFEGWPVAETRLAGEQLRIHRAEELDAPPAEMRIERPVPGRLLGLRAATRGGAVGAEDSLVVACGEGWLGLTEVQRAGKRRMAARDFANSMPTAGLFSEVLG